jgi:NAD(P)H-dependent flavin oxidoreductase YrpB (nitropropane dioxygenase family)
MTTVAWATRQAKVPVIAAGGIGDAHTFLAALALGADAIMMGTTFSATVESPVSERYKLDMLKMRPDDPELIHMVMPGSDTEDYRETMRKGIDTMAEEDHESESQSMSFAVAYVDRIPTVKDVIEGIIGGAEDIVARWEFLK